MIQRPVSLSRFDEWISVLISYIPGSYYWLIKHEIGKGKKKILDAGCGPGTFIYIAGRNEHYNVTGVDIYKPSVISARLSGVYSKVICQDIRKMKFPKKSFDVVLSTQVLEHLTKNDGWKFMASLEKFAIHKVIIVVPMGECEQHAYDDNAHQEHLSRWYPEDFQKKGYSVIGQGQNIYHRNPLIKKVLTSIGPFNNIVFLLHVLFQPFMATRYTSALHLICTKEL